MKRLGASLSLGALLLAIAAAAAAAALPPPPPRKVALEASMLVTGEITVDVEGRVQAYQLDDADKLPGNVRSLVERQARAWRFEPNLVDGRPVSIRNRMGLLLRATPQEDGNYLMRLEDAGFYPMRDEGYDVAVVAMAPPEYPPVAARAGISGTVYLLLRLGADGAVEDVATEQVNLRAALSSLEMKHGREVLARSAAQAARRWRFSLPQRGEAATRPQPWVMRVPVNFTLDKAWEYGKWDLYVAGPREQRPAWAEDDGVAPEVLAAGGVYPVGAEGRLRLLKPSS